MFHFDGDNILIGKITSSAAKLFYTFKIQSVMAIDDWIDILFLNTCYNAKVFSAINLYSCTNKS